MCKEALGWWRAARSVALPFAVDRAEGDSTQIGKSPTRVIRSAVAAAALQPERHEHVPFDRLRITGAHHPDRADRQGRSRPVRRHVSHADGWGTSWLRPEAVHPQRLQLEEYRSIERAPRDPRFAELAERTPTVAQLVHLRWATEGLAVFANTHPFSQDGISLAHNGSISPRPVLD